MHITCADTPLFITALSDDIECQTRTNSEWSLPSQHAFIANDSAFSRNDIGMSGMSGMSGDTSHATSCNSSKSLVEHILVEVALRMCVEGTLFVRVCVCVFEKSAMSANVSLASCCNSLKSPRSR